MSEAVRAGLFAADVSPERARIRTALMELVIERGVDGTSVEDVVGRAQVGREVFERDFEGLRDCCLKVYLANIDEFDRVVFGAAEAAVGWPDRLRAAAYAAARHVEARPLETRFDMVQMLGAGELAQAHRDRYVNRIVDLIDEGRRELEDPDSVSREVAVAVFGSIYQLLQRETREHGEGLDAESFVPQLMYLAVRPYLGHEAALRELERPAPASATAVHE